MTELSALSKKDAGSIATSIIRNLELVLESLSLETSAEEHRLRVNHCVTGDGIFANEAAVKRVLWYMQASSPFKNKITYKVVSLRCASHKANLVTQGAMAHGPSLQEGCLLQCNLVRFFKYLTPVYFDQFASNLRQWVIQNACVVHGTPLEPDARGDFGLRQLYTSKVFLPELVRVLNENVLTLRHLSENHVTVEQGRGLIFDIICQYCLQVQNKPVITRFWLFADCCFTMLRAQLLQVPSDIFISETVHLRNRQAKRIKAFKDWYNNADSRRHLKHTCLCLRLTNLVVSFTARKGVQPGAEPLLVTLARGDVQRTVCQELTCVVSWLHADPSLDLAQALGGLFHTTLLIFVRFAEYACFPAQMYKLCQCFNPDGYISFCEDFLIMDESQLDTGFSRLLQVEALAQGEFHQSLSFLLSQTVQEEIECVLRRLDVTSLDVERKNNLDRRFQKQDRVISLPRASRNSLLETFRVWRSTQLNKKMSAKKAQRQFRTMNKRALAIQQNPHLFSRARGRLHWEQGVSNQDCKKIVFRGDEEALKKYMQDHAEELDRQARALRQQARVHEAGAFPVDNAEWLQWMQDNEKDYAYTFCRLCVV